MGYLPMELKKEDFTKEEIERLKELAQDLNAYGRTMRKVRAGLIWLSSFVIAYLALWEGLVKHFIWKG